MFRQEQMRFSKLFENFLWKKKNEPLISKPEVADKSLANVLETNEYTVWKLISQIRDVSQNREYRYAEYDIMSAEVIISAALNAYADDSTQVDVNSGRFLSIISSDEVLVKDLYTFLEKINYDNFIWDIAYNVAKYGNKYMKVYLTDDKKDISHLESIDDPGCVLDLYHNGKPSYFAENSSDKTLYKESGKFQLYTHDSFIHYFIRSTNQSDILEIEDSTKVDANGEPATLKYKVLEGESLLENVRVIYRILQALEDSLLAARLAKADYIRIFNIEVGNSSNQDTRLIVNKVKKIFDSTVSMDIRNGKYSAMKQPRAWADPIFNSVSNGRGAVTVENIGGDFEVKSIVDIDYFTNKLFAGLGVPKPFFGFEEALGGSLDQSGTLMQLDVRYSKRIKKIIDAIVAGTQVLCNLWLKLRGRIKSINNFKVVYVSPSSHEDYARLREIKERAAIANEVITTITSNAPDVNSTELLNAVLSQFIPYQGFLDSVRPLLEKAAKAGAMPEDEGFGEGEDSLGGEEPSAEDSSISLGSLKGNRPPSKAEEEALSAERTEPEE